MKSLAPLTVAVLAATGAHAAPVASTPSSPASRNAIRLLDLVRTNDATGFSALAPNLVIMRAPDFGVPLGFADARKVFDGCTLSAVAEAKPIEGVPGAASVTATMTCAMRPPVAVEFLAGDRQVYSVAPAGMSVRRSRP
jgi:hypothetical protein